MKISLHIHFLYLFFENHQKCLNNVHLIPGLSAGERDPLPLSMNLQLMAFVGDSKEGHVRTSLLLKAFKLPLSIIVHIYFRP